MKYCRYCGGEVSDTAKACGHCGRWLATQPAVPPPAPASQEEEQAELEPVAPRPVEPVSTEPEELKPVTPSVPPELEQGVSASLLREEVKPEPLAPSPAEHPLPEAREVQPAAGVPPIEVGPPETRRVKQEPPAQAPVERQALALKPSRRIPVWAWGLGAVAILLVAGAALVGSGALRLPGQQPAAPRPTATLAATPWATRAPASAPEPVMEPLTISLGREDVWQTVDADQEVIVDWVWGVCDPALIEDNLDALEFKVTVDGEVVSLGNMADYRTELLEEESGGLYAWWQHYAYPLGGFGSGSTHWLDLERSFSRDVTDGCDGDGDGSPDRYGPESSLTSTVHLVVR